MAARSWPVGGIVLALCSLVACGDGDGGDQGTIQSASTGTASHILTTTTTEAVPTTSAAAKNDAEANTEDVGPAAMAAALAELVSEQQLPFTEYLIQSRIDPAAGSPESAGSAGRPLTDAERAAIEGALSSVGPVRWIDDPAAWRTVDLRPSVDGAAILGVGEPTFDGDESALVPVSLWCGGTCGVWLSYRVRAEGDQWHVIGTEGPVAEA